VGRISSSAKYLAVALAVLLAACVTAEDLKKSQDSWLGASYEEVLRAWGAPSRSTKTADGRDWHTWVAESYPASGSSIGFGGFGFGRGGGVGVGIGMPIGSPPPPERCERTLIFLEDKVVDQQWNGPRELCYRSAKARGG
jgi:hypothetical protein